MSSSEPEPKTADKATTPESTNADVSAAVEDLLNTLSNKFASVSSEIFAKMDEMSRRLDSLETQLAESKGSDGSSSKTQ